MGRPESTGAVLLNDPRFRVMNRRAKGERLRPVNTVTVGAGLGTARLKDVNQNQADRVARV